MAEMRNKNNITLVEMTEKPVKRHSWLYRITHKGAAGKVEKAVKEASALLRTLPQLPYCYYYQKSNLRC